MGNSIVRRVAIALILACAALLIRPASATELVDFDGTWWTSLTDDEQVTAVEGLLGGYESGFNNGYLAAGVNDVNHYHSTRSAAQLTGDPSSNVHFTKTFGAYQQEITDFYSAHQSSMHATVGDVMSCLSDDPQFTCDQVASWRQ
jgi:hypothetical protein